ncbi:hypothetical protein HLK59_33710 [Streptomyces sp. S3(2020)]|uniref:hypothetical protein n=1 Tax=Streptomyces sp. S3(2020) TaxID=2732044 RepID=UPI001489493E|nr:hypothetical protein [Streptomyces sp. S3(2020)]NNN35236.1 hypothetical protein [Streptomyces sp. S3(2020)]
MSRRRIRKMLREMSGGGPVSATSALGTIRTLSRLAFYAEQFGYRYASVHEVNRKFQILVVPDPDPRALARAAHNWTWYPDAADGGALPPLDADAVAVLKARMSFELATRFTEKQMIGITVFGFTGLAVGPWIKFGLVVGGPLWVAFMALVAVLLVANRRYRAKHSAVLESAGFTAVTDPDGRPRYLPPAADRRD